MTRLNIEIPDQYIVAFNLYKDLYKKEIRNEFGEAFQNHAFLFMLKDYFRLKGEKNLLSLIDKATEV